MLLIDSMGELLTQLPRDGLWMYDFDIRRPAPVEDAIRLGLIERTDSGMVRLTERGISERHAH